MEFDRATIVPGTNAGVLRAWSGERFDLTGLSPPEAGTVSVRGRFLDDRTIEVNALHVHRAGARDIASYLGLTLVVLWWGLTLFRPRKRRGE